MNKDYSTFGGMYGVDTPVQGTFCTQPNGQQGVINDRGQCVAQAPLFAPSTVGMFNINNVPNPNLNLDASDYGDSAADYITNVNGVDPNGGIKPGYSGQEQSAMMDKAKQEVERAYRLYLGRGSDPGGLDYYSNKVFEAALHKNPDAIKAIMNEIKNSPEGMAYAESQANATPPVETPVDPPVETPVDPPVDPPVETPEVPPVETPVDPPEVPPVDPPVGDPEPVNCPEGQTRNAQGECVSSTSTNSGTNTGTKTYTEADVNDLYVKYLKRDAEQGGLYYWLNYLNTGGSLADLEYNILNSDEYLGLQNGTTSTNLPSGSFLGKQCSGTTMIIMFADGEGGSTQIEAANSPECGYSAPPPPPAPVPGVDLGFGTPSNTSPVSAGVGTVTGNTGGAGIGNVTGYDYTPYQATRSDRVDYVKMLQGWLTNSLFQDII